MDKGEDRADRTGTGTRAMFALNMSIDLAEGFPILTTKKVPFKSVVAELLWFIEGSGDERRLAELTHGTRDPAKKTIWSPNAEGTTGSAFKPEFSGDLGRVYGVQWRSWKTTTVLDYDDYLGHGVGTTTYFGAKAQTSHTDQLAEVVDKLRTRPTDRRILMSAWNPGELDQMALPPCHMFVQFYLSNDRKLSCQMYQRSVDAFLGLPWNMPSYALLTHILAKVIGADVGTLTICMGDTHIYRDHFEQVKTQLSRNPHPLPKLVISDNVTNIDHLSVDDFTLDGYVCEPAIKAHMSA